MEVDVATAKPVANLVVVAGFGELGSRVTTELQALLRFVPAAQGHCVLPWIAGGEQPSLAEAVQQQLLSQANLDQVGRVYQLPSRSLGQRLDVYFLFVVDAHTSQDDGGLDAALSQVGSLNINASLLCCAVGAASLLALVSMPIVGRSEWHGVVPFPMGEEAAGTRSDADLVATVARTLLVLATPGYHSLLDEMLPRGSAGTQESVSLVRAGAAFVDGQVDHLIRSLAGRAGGELLRRQFGDPTPHQPPAAYDDGHRTRVQELVQPAGLAQALLAGTPFVLETPDDGPWHVKLPASETAVELHGLQRQRWVPVLRKLKDFFDFTKARRWREALEAAVEQQTRALQTAMLADVDALHLYPRAPDRVLVWCTLLTDRLERPFEIARPPTADFQAAIGKLRRAIAAAPRSSAVWVRIILLAVLGGGAARLLLEQWHGGLAGLGALAAAAMIGFGAGFRLLQVAHARVMKARTEAVRALASHYEAQMAANLRQALVSLRTALSAVVQQHGEENQRLAEAATKRAEELVRVSHKAAPVAIVNVEWAVPAEKEAEYLTHLSLPWEQMLADAASSGCLVPQRDTTGEARVVPDQSATLFAQNYLDSRRHQLGLAQQIEFCSQTEAAYLERVLADLNRRSRVLATGVSTDANWLAPAQVLACVQADLQVLDPKTVSHAIEAELLACVRVGPVARAVGDRK